MRQPMQVSRIILLSLFFITIILPNDSYSQKNASIGVFNQLEKSNNSGFRYASGIILSNMIGPKIELELEMAYRTIIDKNISVTVPIPPNSSGTIQYHLKQKFLSIPLLAGYKSKILNFSMGPSLDLFLGWDNKGYTANPPATPASPLPRNRFDKDLLWGAKFKLSRTIPLSNEIFLEPYIFFNPVFTKYSYFSNNFSYSRQFWGLNLPIKFKLGRQHQGMN
jgi:hypothetical protein